MHTLRLATLLAVGTAADSYLDALAQSQGSLPPGVVYAPGSDSFTSPSAASGPGSAYLPISAQLSPAHAQFSLKNYDVSSLIPIGLTIATVLKVILKFLIFKMIVKFIAVICLLLFLPKLEEKPITTTSTTTPAAEEGRHLIIEAITREPKVCRDGDLSCYMWQTLSSVSLESTRQSSKSTLPSTPKQRGNKSTHGE
ncbi:uncharacterized protein LOC120350862 [Nilaparvata lugens]|uniref:uncharacterized protein LOC120350862 n=1 Tax=Nilaparvata lugens TaxID=108931 RepID=UPI00193CD5C4|nr:uncharacterized protein LOC120350862 [Nilaparvata lugens]